MSAIAGILYFHEVPVESGLIRNLTAAMKSRGPDEQTHWVEGSMALGHCMLRTTPEAAEEHQPVISSDQNLVLVWDGRLDNREELRRDLLSEGAQLRNNTDIELVLQSYACWGEDCPKRFLGDFAFAVWDISRQILFCARDHMGAKPFFYVVNDSFFAFASEDEALISLPGITSRPNEERIAYFLVPEFLDFDYQNSWLRDVWSLAAAQSITVEADGNQRKKTYWSLASGEETRYKSVEDCRAAFLEVFGEAVRCRLRGNGDIATMMSGGLDSAGMVAMIKRLLPEMPGSELHTYSTISDHPKTCIESQCILSLTEGLGDRAHFLSVPSFTGMLSAQDLIDNAWSAAHPIDNSLMLPAMMCRAASRNGHRVLLHGVCGDLVTYAPLRYIAWHLRAGEWSTAWRECRAASRNNAYLRGTLPLMLFLKNIWFAYVPEAIRRPVNKVRRLKARSPLANSLVNHEFAERLRLVERMLERENRAVPTLRDLHKDYIRVLSPPHGLTSSLSGYDRIAGRYGVELRDPWADRRLVEFFLRLPIEYRVHDGWTKYLVRTAFAEELSPQVRWRLGKEHMGWVFYHRLMDENLDLVQQAIENDLDLVERYVDLDAVRAQYQKYSQERGDIEREKVYDIITLAFWLKRIRA